MDMKKRIPPSVDVDYLITKRGYSMTVCGTRVPCAMVSDIDKTFILSESIGTSNRRGNRRNQVCMLRSCLAKKSYRKFSNHQDDLDDGDIIELLEE